MIVTLHKSLDLKTDMKVCIWKCVPDWRGKEKRGERRGK